MSPASPKHPRSPTTPPSPTTSPTHSILRRTASTLSAPSHSHKKMLRFTQVHRDSDTLLSTLGQNEDVYYHGRTVEEGLYTDRLATDRRRYHQSDPGTPNFQETADQIRRTLSLASVDSLLLLSVNQSERTKFLAEVSRAGRGLVWRDESEQCLLPQDNERAIVLALKRGLRSFILAFSVRSGINVLLLLFRLLRKHAPKLSLPLLRHAIFGPEPFRFGGMIGTFTLLYTFTLHLLRLAPPLSYFRRRIRAGLWNKTTFGPPEREGNEGERRWQAAVAGAVGSLGLLWEGKSRRRGVAQQMFVRGLQASYNQYTPRFGIHIPHGDLLLFGACCGQIMFAFLMSPETIPKEYNNWILAASRVPSFAILANRTQVRQGYIQDALVQEALNYKGITATNRRRLENVLQKIRGGQQPDAVPCGMVHPWCNSCTETNFRRFFAVCRFMLPVYSALHLIPMLVLRRHHVKRDPVRMMARALWGIGRSCSFLGVFVVIYQVLFCARVQALEKSRGSNFIRNLLKRKEVFWALGFTTCLSLIVEEKKRRAELAMYVLPRALESAWSGARKRAWVPLVPFGETILGAAAMAMVMDSYKHQPDAMSGIVRRLLFQLVGPG
ncbi:hypothetical protein I308_100493 [Cryptococcus tetragattii IND107]|uniref:Transmembrane protein 135 N-terminal domain-containing protein n=1 Tax=Cryptococcus tetragattii IND107 TaxID=1296105 RepID=A0ABR3C4Y8_9TREE|nr:hypothetical protein I308_00367 [Cryptococcus tetragattii IND107]